MHGLGRMKRLLALGMAAVALLGGCGSSGGDPSSSSVPLSQEEDQEETMAQELQKQLIAILNLNRNEEETQVGDSDALETAVDFFLEYVLQDPQKYLTQGQDPSDLDGMLREKNTYAFVYDGSLPAVEVGRKILSDLEKLDDDTGTSGAVYGDLSSIAITYGEGEKGALWLVLATTKLKVGPAGGTGSGQTGSTGSGQTGSTGSDQTTDPGSGETGNTGSGTESET